MTQITYEFEIFDDLLTGCLTPDEICSDRLQEIIDTLKESDDKCINMVLGEFDTSKKEPQLKQRLELCNHHPLAKEYFIQNELPFEINSIEQIPKSIVNQLEINPDKTECVYSSSTGKRITVGVRYSVSFEKLEISRLKYCFYNRILEKQIEEIKRRLKFNLYPLEDKKVCQYVKKTQFILLNFAMEVTHKFDITPDRSKPLIKKEYTNDDCMALVYLYIIDLINYLEQHFKQYIDADLQVPFHSDLLNKYNFPRKAKNIERKLKKQDLDKSLLKMIQKPLNKILNLGFDNRITYHEVNYFKTFLTEIEQGLYQEDMNQDSFDKILIEVDYNEFEISEFLINKMNEKLKKKPSIVDKELYLIEKRKTISQIIIRSTESFNKINEPLKNIIIQWIEGELYYLKTLAVYDEKKEHEAEKLSTEIEKLEVNLSVPQLSLFLRLLSETEITNDLSLRELTRWVASHISTPAQSEISSKNLYNRSFEPTTNTIREIKARIIQMINRINDM